MTARAKSTSPGDLIVERRGPVALITLNRPEKLNAFTTGLLDELRSSVEESANDPGVVGIIITGAGRGFCAGLDAAELGRAVASGSGGQADVRPGDLPGLFSWLLSIPKPVIAAVNGVAAGGGFVLALMSDIRIASTQAEFTSVFSKRGLIAEHGSSWLLPRLVGVGRALDLLWTSRKIDAAEAWRIGLVEQVTKPAELLEAAEQYIRELAEGVSPSSLAETKRLVYSHLGLGYEAALIDAETARLASLDRADAREGAAAFNERRPPRFPGIGQERG